MANESKVLEVKGRRKFLAVDVWRNEFGSVSQTAIFDVYMTAFKVKQDNMYKHPFNKCVEALRKLENPEYETGDLALN